jgi:hypothetical protein
VGFLEFAGFEGENPLFGFEAFKACPKRATYQFQS